MPASTRRSIDLIVLATSTPDNTFPGDGRCGAERARHHPWRGVRPAGGVFRLHLWLTTADSLLRTGAGKRALVIGAETFSRILDWTDRGTCVLFGDGAGAVVLEAQTQPGEASDRGVLTTHLRSDGRHKESCSSMAARPRRRRWVTCAWKAARSSNMRWA